jgi:hypothetical protein
MKAAIVIVALVLGGCGAANRCQGETTTVEGLRTVVEHAEENEDEAGAAMARATLEAAERAQQACLDRAEGDWLLQIVELFAKVAISLAR